MKKALILAAGLLVASVAVKAQDHKMWVSGAVGLSSTSTDIDDTDPVTTGTFSPSFGYNINEKITLGLGLVFESTKFDDDNKESAFFINPFARYNKSVGDKTLLYGEAGLMIGSRKETVAGDDNDGISSFGIRVAPGVQYFFTDRWSANAEWAILSYMSDNDKDAEVKTNTINFGLDLRALSFALNYHFGGGK